MTSSSTESLSWSLYRDASCSESARVFQGLFNLTLVRPTRRQLIVHASNETSGQLLGSLPTTGLQLVPEIQSRVWNLFERRPHLCDQLNAPLDSKFENDVEVVPVAVENLSLSAEAAEELELTDDKALLYCKLQLRKASGCGSAAAYKEEGSHDNDWFSWKLQRAEEYRVRGNEAFKQESYSVAVRLYKRALAWLEPPAAWSDTTLDIKGQYSVEELHQVNHVAVACYVNLATSYSKIDGDGDVDRCIAAASSALAIDKAHMKARYRRSQAYAQSKAFDLALADLTKLLELEPTNTFFRAAFARARRAKTELCKKQQTAYANLFG